MSKLISQRFEYAIFDDATVAQDGSARTLTSTPPFYPPTLEHYSSNATASAATSYGTTTVTVGPNVQTLNVPIGATIVAVGAASNTVDVGLVVTNVALTPGGAPTNFTWPIAPGQIVTLPGVFNPGTFQVVSCLASLASSQSPGTVTLMWGI